jgi:hypothetical protein
MSLGRNFRITSADGAVPSSSCCATTAKPFLPPSWNAISPHGVRRRGVPSLPPRPVSESNSVPTRIAVAALGTVCTPALSRRACTPFHFEAFGPPLARW